MKHGIHFRRLIRSDLIPIAAVLTIFIAILAASPFLLDALWGNVPILFYGRIVDDNGHPVAGAAVSMHVIARKRLQLPIPFSSGQTGWTVRTTTDSEGRFFIRGGRGIELNMIAVEKPGYTWASSSIGRGSPYDYSSKTGSATIYHPDADVPEVYVLHKR
jgi:hypothetical protein